MKSPFSSSLERHKSSIENKHIYDFDASIVINGGKHRTKAMDISKAKRNNSIGNDVVVHKSSSSSNSEQKAKSVGSTILYKFFKFVDGLDYILWELE